MEKTTLCFNSGTMDSETQNAEKELKRITLRKIITTKLNSFKIKTDQLCGGK